MKIALATLTFFLCVFFLHAPAQGQSVQSSSDPQDNLQKDTTQKQTPDLSTIAAEVQQAAQTANRDIGRLHVDRWKTETSQKQQMQQVSESLQRNLTNAIPDLITDLQASPNSVSKAFKLYHNMNVLYEFMNSLTEAAANYGKKDEYEPMEADVNALDNVRQKLSTYIEQLAQATEAREAAVAAAAQAQQAATPPAPPKKIVVDDTTQPQAKKVKKTTKKVPAAAPATVSSQ